MMIKSQLTQLYLEYESHSTSKNYEKLHEQILFYAYRFPTILSAKNKEHCGDFVLYVVNLVPRIISRFHYYGRSLESYLFITFKGQFYSYITEINKKEKMLSSYTRENTSFLIGMPTFVHEDILPYKTSNYWQKKEFKLKDLVKSFRFTENFNVFCKRFWIYLLKNSAMLPEEEIYHLALSINISKEECALMLKSLKKIRLEMMDKKARYNEKCEKIFSKYIQLEYEWEENEHLLSTEQKQILIEKIKKYRTLYDGAIEAYRKMKFFIPNDVLAKTIHVSKGSIDSAIFHLRKMCSEKKKNFDIINLK